MKLGQHPRFRISVELEPLEAHRHADARAAAERILKAIEQVKFGAAASAAPQVVKVLAVRIEELP